jgi:SAM-dependent methyltransferase
VNDHVGQGAVHGRSVLEVGSMDVNGSVRPQLESLGPARYVGVDIAVGPGVDEVCNVADLVVRFGANAFEMVISTELVEHVRDWRSAFDQMKRVLAPGGLLVLTTRSVGFKVHGYPYDFWRYQPEDMRRILVDFTDVVIEEDDLAPGVFVKARKPANWKPTDVNDVALHSVVTSGRAVDVTDAQVVVFKCVYRAHQLYRRILPEWIRGPIRTASRRLLVRRNQINRP